MAADETSPPSYAPRPRHRRLRAYAFDPCLSEAVQGPVHRGITLSVPWEDLRPGPVGEYLEIIDFDPVGGGFAAPVDLDAPWILAQDGLPPDAGSPQFRQQTVYALAMATIGQFEKALGRVVLWSPSQSDRSGTREWTFVRRLRIHPHGSREAEVEYDPARKALLMGFFWIDEPVAGGGLFRSPVFACLSPAVVARGTALAILDGLRPPGILENGGTEGSAFPDAFAEAVGLLQQFALPGFLAAQVAFTADPAADEARLRALAGGVSPRFAASSERRREIDPLAGPVEAEPFLPTGPRRGAVLVAAVFDAFLKIFRRRRGEWLRPAAISRDPLDSVAALASRCASQLLQMCIRALDYCPPCEVTSDDYLRALITADTELVPDDERGYRIAVVEAFWQRGIRFPGGVPYSSRALCWPVLKNSVFLSIEDRGSRPSPDRADEARQEVRRRDAMDFEPVAREMGFAVGKDAPATVAREHQWTVESMRLSRRVGPGGRVLEQWVVVVTQRRRGYFDPDVQQAQDGGAPAQEPDFWFYGGGILLADPATGRVRMCIANDILSDKRLADSRSRLLARSLETASDSETTGGPPPAARRPRASP